MSATQLRSRSFTWLIRREIWENRFLYIAPIAVAMLVVAAYMVGTLHLAAIMMIHAQNRDGGPVVPPLGLPYSIAAMSVIFTGIVTGIFYCVGALYNDRRDRSILFWKSLPVSDLATVLSKASIPLIILPIIIFFTTLAMQLVMLAVGALYAVTHAEMAPAFWMQWPFFHMSLLLIYGLTALALWYAPIFGWLLMVSAWARRAPFLWVVLPPLTVCIAERIAFNTSILWNLLSSRLTGGFDAAFSASGQNPGIPLQFGQIAPLQFLATPELWIGLILTIVFLTVATRLRRLRGPL